MKQRGFVLLMVLIVISVMSLIGIYTLRLGQNEQRLARQSLMAYQREIHYLNMLSQIENTIMDSLPPCVIESQPAWQIAKQPLIWWELNGCLQQVLSLRYLYVVEDMGLDNCAVIANSKDIAHYFHIYMLIKPINGNMGSMLMHSSVVKADKPSNMCQYVEHVVSAGRQKMSWIVDKGMNHDAIFT